MRFVEDEFLLATRVGRPETEERLAQALAIREARRVRKARKARKHSRVVEPAGARVVLGPLGRPRRQQFRAGR